MHSRDPSSPSAIPLPPIDEEDISNAAPRFSPTVPPRAWNRPAHKVFGLGQPPRLNFEGSPPAYSQFDSTEALGPHGEKLSDWGWSLDYGVNTTTREDPTSLKCSALINISNRSSNSSGNSSGGASGSLGGGPTNPASNTTFPAGSYSIETYLDTVSTNCTSNSAAWTCFPYVTYDLSPSQSAATFDWIISPVEGSSDYTVSSTQNPFSLVFTNASLSLMDVGTDQEHYYFQIDMQKPVVPAVALTNSNAAGTCYFNQTTFQASLYTKLEKTYPAMGTSNANTTEAFSPWPYAVKIEQVSAAGPATPTCLDTSGNSLGDFSVPDTANMCECLYLNTRT
ncbi:hypothetical protein D0Z07_2095 [Hyphodiscus hymeniophilus]|uniref:Uncharacterized protein n=1 Tax=Hyphodiscus hymeniophilus TaxID=353542 RepID=A0A9P6VNR8_9HELO|nr:hypothetical protein D0Z07_2095 [Hyphodiscus hymeniophilus]